MAILILDNEFFLHVLFITYLLLYLFIIFTYYIHYIYIQYLLNYLNTVIYYRNESKYYYFY